MPYGHEDVVRRLVNTFPLASFNVPWNNIEINMFTLPTGFCEIISQYIVVTTAFAGLATITAMTGHTTAPNGEYLASHDIKTAGLKYNKGSEWATEYLIPNAGGPVYLRVDGSGLLNTMTQGGLTVYTAYIYHNY